MFLDANKGSGKTICKNTYCKFSKHWQSFSNSIEAVIPHDTAGHQTGGGRDGGVPLREDVQGGGHREEPQRHAGDIKESRGSADDEALHY